MADAETGQPLEGAEVVLMDLHRLARANAMGEARLDDVPLGPQRVRVRMLGYAPADVSLAFASDTTGAVFRLSRTATALAAVNVEADRTPLRMRDVERRRRQGIGRFLSAEQLDKDRDRDFGYLIAARFPGVRLTTGTDGRQHLMSARGTGKCPLQVYVDDIPFGQEEDIWIVRTWDVDTVEFYSGSQVPAAYRSRLGNGCGLLLVWLKWI